jgi:type I restriction enzyme S subunit
MNWIDSTVGEYCPFVYGKGLPKTKRKIGEYPVYGSNGCVDYHRDSYINGPGLIIGRKGSVGAVHLSEVPFWPIDTAFYVTKETLGELRFTYYLLRSLGLEEMNTDSAVPGLNRDNAHSLSIRIPATTAEREILGNKLAIFDKKIGLNNKTNQTLEKMVLAIYKSWFVDFDPVKAKMRGEQPVGMDVAIAAVFPDKLVESELGLIPEGWAVKKFKEVIDKYIDNRGKTPPLSEEGIPLIEVKHIPANSNFPILNTDKKFTEETYNTWFRSHVEPKDILISTVGTIGRTSFIKDTRFGIAQNVLGLRFGETATPEYMFYTIKAHRFQHDMDARLVTTVQSSIKRKDLDTIDILLPPEKVQERFSTLVAKYLDTQFSKTQENLELEKLRDTLLPKLLSEEIPMTSEINGN